MTATLSNELETLRRRHGLSQRELAFRSGVSAGTINELENNRRKPHPGTVQKLATALGVTVEELWGPSRGRSFGVILEGLPPGEVEVEVLPSGNVHISAAWELTSNEFYGLVKGALS